jgi:hypothetical protein
MTMETAKPQGRLLALLTVALLLGGCSQGVVRDTAASDMSECFWAESIYDWRAIDDQHLVVWSPSRHCPYLVSFSMRCHGLRFTDEIGFKDRDGRICPYGGDAVIVPGPTGSRCTIATISRMTPEEVDIALKREAKSADKPLDTCERQ